MGATTGSIEVCTGSVSTGSACPLPGGPAGAPARRPAVRAARAVRCSGAAPLPVAWSAAGADSPFGAPFCRALIASSRSDLRIRAVPLIPSPEAIP